MRHCGHVDVVPTHLDFDHVVNIRLRGDKFEVETPSPSGSASYEQINLTAYSLQRLEN